MVFKCCVYGCKGNYASGDKVSVFRFPKDPKLSKIWESRTMRENFQATSSSRFCESHFRKEDILRKAEYFDTKTGRLLVSELKYPKLKEGAVPVVISPACPPSLQPSVVPSRDSPAKKRQRLENEQIQKAQEASVQAQKEYLQQVTFGNLVELKNSLMEEAMRCKERWRGIRDTYKRGLNKKRNNELKSNKYADFPLEFLVEHVTDQRARGLIKQAGPPENEVALVKVEPPSPGDNSTVSEDFILPDHLNEDIASEPDTNSSSTKSGPDQPLVVLPQSNDRPQLSRMLVVRRTPTPSGTPTTGVQQPFVVVGNDGLAKTTTAVVMNANASSQPQFVMMPTTAQQQQFVVVGQQQQANTGNNNNNNDVTSPQQFVVVGQQQQANTSNNTNDVTSPQQFVVVGQQQQANTSNSNNKNDVTSPQQFVVVGQQQQGKTNNKNVKAVAYSVPPKVSSGRKKKKKRVVEESDDSDGENPVDSFFRSMAQTVKKFPPLLVAEAKMEVCRVVTRLECEMLKGRFDQPSISNSFVCDSASEPKKEESILGYSLFS